ncbi:MAG: hypothetical protein IT429_07550 [Gemmataceae bacterium]|nr:hypothetical protein [Gemmataceae bacterium]
MRKFVCAAVIAVCAFGVAMADEFGVIITKIDGNKIVGTKKGKKGAKGEAVELTIAAGAKINKGKYDKEIKKTVAAGEYTGGLDALKEAVSKAEKGVGATVVTGDDGKVTEIRVSQKKKKKKDAN